MILVSGSLAFDQIMDFPGKFSDYILPGKTHLLNVSFLVEKMRLGFGGTAGNIAYNLSLLGMKVGLLGMVGEDFSAYRQFLARKKIDLSALKTVEGQFTAKAVGITDSLDNQIWGFYPGADNFSEKLSIFAFQKKIDFGVVAPHNPRAMMKFVREYQKAKIPYLFDFGMQLPWLTKENLREAFFQAKIIIGNDYEIFLAKKKASLKDFFSEFDQEKIVITTCGKKGAKIKTKKETIFVSAAKPKRVLDPAGAGDAFRAGFLAGFLRGFSLRTCAQMGAVAAVYTVEKYGTTTHSFTLKEFAQRYWENYGEKIFLN